MSRPFLIIDGYNLMHAAGLARRTYGPGDLERCRNRLIARLSSRLSDAAAERTTIVFDAFAADDDSERHQVLRGLTIVFAPRGTDADSEIERQIAAHPAPRQLVIVSSDQRLHKAARRRRCQPIDSDEFWNGLEQDAAAEKLIHGSPSAKPDVDFLPPEFLEIDIPADDGGADAIFDADYLSDLEDEVDD